VQDINLYHLLKFYAKNWIWIVTFTTIGVLSGFAYNNYIQTPLYKSSATLLLISPADQKAAQDATLINNYVELFKSRRVLEPVIKKQNLNTPYESLVSSIEATNEKTTEVIKVSISTDNAQTSKSVAEGAVASFKEQVTQLYGTDNVNVVDNANLPTSPYNVHEELVLLLAGAIGFMATIIVLFFIYDLTPKTKKKRAAKSKTEEVAAAKEIKAATQRKTTKKPVMKKVVDLIVGVEAQPVTKKVSKKKPTTK